MLIVKIIFDILRLACDALIVSLFLYSKLLPYKDRLTGRSRSAFLFINKIFEPVLRSLKKVARPAQVGNGLFVDMSQVIVLVVLLMLLNLFH